PGSVKASTCSIIASRCDGGGLSRIIFTLTVKFPTLIRYGLSSLSLICSCAGRKGSLGENLAAASMMSRDSINSCPMLRAGEIFIPGCLPLAYHSGSQQMLFFALFLGNGKRRDPRLPRATDSFCVLSKKCRSDLLTQVAVVSQRFFSK